MPLQSQLARRGNGLCLLSFDAGGSRCISQLKILAEMMHRLNFGADNDTLDRPCAVFDMIGGVGSGGFIAILLVVFGLKAEEALNEFVDLSVNVLDKLGLDAQGRTEALRSHINNLMIKYGMSQEPHLLDPNERSQGCKLVVPISYKHHLGSTCVLRNFSVRQERTIDFTIVEALLATVATPPLLQSLSLTKDAAVFEFIGADWTLSNPTQEIMAEAHGTFGAEAMVACVLSLGCGHPGVFSFPERSESVEWAQSMEKLATNAERRAQSLESQVELIGKYHRFSVTNGLERGNSSNDLNLGAIIAHTMVYIGDAQVSRRLDACVHSLGILDGNSLRKHLTHLGGNATSHPHLPPLTRTFVMRKEPWDFINKIILGPREVNDADTRRMLIVTGIGGCGKTQLMIKFMSVHEAWFSSRFFIDGSNEDRIKADIIRNVHALGTEHSQKGFDECLFFLSDPQNNKPQFLLYDNVDDPEIDLSPLLPRGSSCTIVITSRNRILGNIYPESHLRLDIMSMDEAVNLLSHGSVSLTEQGRKDVEELAHSLGCLPIALQQARSYMQHTGCSIKSYLERLSSNRTKLLGREIKQQLDMKAISTYAAFETSFSRLPLYVQKLLRLLAHFHWSGFPLNLITLAAKYQFSEYKWKYIDHGREFYSGKQMLEAIFHRDEEWDVTNLDDMLLSLQNYSLVTVVSGVETSISQIHPLVHEWLRSGTPNPAEDDYQSAAVILLALGVHGSDTAIMRYLSSHVMHMSSFWDRLHIHNVLAFAEILRMTGEFQFALKLQEKGVRELREMLNIDDLRLNNSLWNLALIYRGCGRLNEARDLQEEMLKKYKRVLGDRHRHSLGSSTNLAGTYVNLGQLADAQRLQEEVLEKYKEVLGERDPDTLCASANLAATYRNLWRLPDAEVLQVEVLKMSKEILGERHPDTLRASASLANTYRSLGWLPDAEVLEAEVLKMSKEVLGERHPDTLNASANLAATYRQLGQLADAEVLEAEVLKMSKEVLGERHPDTLRAARSLATTYHSLGRLREAEIIQVEALKTTKEVLGERHFDTLNASAWLSGIYRDLGHLNRAELLFDEVLKTYKEILGERNHITIDISHELAITYREQGRFQDALAVQMEVLKSLKEIQGDNHPETIDAISSLASVLHHMGRLDEAETLATEALNRRVEILGIQHHDTLTSSNNLAAICRDLGKLEEAEAMQLEVLVSMKETLGERHFKTTKAMLVLAKIYQSQRRKQEALELLTTAEHILSDYLGVDHPQYIECQNIKSDVQKLDDSVEPETDSQVHVDLNPESPTDGLQPPAKRRRLI